MTKMEFPIFKTKMPGLIGKFNLTDPVRRRAYFEAKAGEEIQRLKNYLQDNTFIAYMLAKKSAGKGTYAGMLTELFGQDHLVHLSVGDIVRSVDQEMADPEKREELEKFLQQNYRGFISLDQVFEAQENRSTQKLLPTEFILSLIEREINKYQKKAILIDGFPRDMDQVSYSLFFRALVGYREDPDFFILIQVPEMVIDERMKTRVVCPICQMSRNIKLLPTKEIGYDLKKQEFFLKCENQSCAGARMIPKEGDELGIQNIKDRLAKDEKLMERAMSLYGVPKVLLRNSVPASQAGEFIDDYEITPEYVFSWDEATQTVKTSEKPWLIKDDDGIESYSLLAPAVVVSLIKQMVDVLGI